MAIVETQDLEGTRQRLAAWLGRKLPQGSDRLEISELKIPQGAGHSNATLLFDARWNERGEQRSGGFVARVRPSGRGVFPEYDMQLQFRCMQILGARSSIPVPKMLWFEDDVSVLGQPFYLMEKLDGIVPPDNPPYAIAGWVAEATAEQQEALWRRSIELLARIHGLDWRALGFAFLDRPEYGPTGFAQQLAYYREYLAWASNGTPAPELVDALAWLEANRPSGDEVVLNWGDARISNMMYRDFAPVAVLDWEMACLGPAEADLAWFLFMNDFLTTAIGLPGIAGFPDAAATADEYARHAGKPIRDLRYFSVWAAFRFAVIMQAIESLMAHNGIDSPGIGGMALTALAKVRASAE
jgi:aminoglycoside phosphotransferase (APT) family kinase protein